VSGSAKIVVVAISALVLIGGLAIDRHSSLASYLVAWIAIGAIPIGALCVLMTSYLVRRAWTERLHPILVAATSVLPVVGILFVPVLIGMGELYPAASDTRSLPALKAFYLSPWFFAFRAVVYFLLLWLVARWQRAVWNNPDRMVRSASAGMIVYALVVSFAGIDWLESLEPEFHSSIYGLLYLCFAMLNGVAFGIGMGLWSGRPIGAIKGYSALLLSVILLWAYIHAMQYIVIWAGNIPKEVVWYLKRSSDRWQFVMAFVALCGWTLMMRCREAAILVLPAVPHTAPLALCLLLPAALAFVGVSLWWAFENALSNDGRLLGRIGQRARAGAEAR
jgi:hypothetical protein